jgi:hypothetical protein
MDSSVSDFPDLPTLTVGLTGVFCTEGREGQCLTVLNRQPASTASTFPSEIVTCQIDDGRQLRLYCKYAIGYNHSNLDNRQGLAYEAAVYRHVLQPIQATTPAYHGTHSNPATGETWLVLEYLDESVPVNHTPEPAALVSEAARWIARFHAVNEDRLADSHTQFLVRHDARYYRGWSRRTLLFAGDLRSCYPWLKPLCQKYEDLVDLLVAQPPTVIHGEFDSDNLLWRDGVLYPVDWESAAIAAGEMDVARLTWGWPAQMARGYELEYRRNRWPAGSPSDFAPAMTAARLYLPFRFLGERPEWTVQDTSAELFEELRTVGEQMELI